MIEFEKFSKPKPRMFPLFVDPRQEKIWDIQGDFGFDLLAHIESQEAALFAEGKASPLASNMLSSGPILADTEAFQKSLFLKAQQAFRAMVANRRSTIDMFAIVDAFQHLPAENRIQIEISASGRANYQTESAEEVATHLTTPFWNDSSIEESIFNSDFLTQNKELPGAGSTIPHNVDLFAGLGFNYLLDEVSQDLMSQEYSEFFNQFMTPRAILSDLDPQFWTKMMRAIDKIQNRRMAPGIGNPVSFGNPFDATDTDNDLNWERVESWYTEELGYDTRAINAGPHAVVASGLWLSFTPEEVFYFMNSNWEKNSRLMDTMRGLVGRASQNSGTGESGEVSAIETWWQEVGAEVDDRRISLYAAFSDLAPQIFKMMDWANWKNTLDEGTAIAVTDERYQFKEKMIGGYLGYLSKTFLYDKFRGDYKVTPERLAIGTLAKGQEIFDSLVAGGYVTLSGQLTSTFKPSDPGFNLVMPFSERDKAQTLAVLREAAIGSFGLDVKDQQQVNGKPRYNFKLQMPDGSSRSFTEIMDLIGSGKNVTEQYENVRTAYNIFFDMVESMTGLNLNSSGSDGGLKYTQNADGTVSVVVYPEGSWEQHTEAGTWERVQPQPLYIQFNSLAEAKTFLKDVRTVISLVEPLVGTFNSIDHNGPGSSALTYEGGQLGDSDFRVLVDNAGSMANDGVITQDHPNYQLSVDTVFQAAFFETPRWKSSASYLRKQVLQRMMLELGAVAQTNRALKSQNKREKTKYGKEKDEHDEEEFLRLRMDVKRRNHRIRAMNEYQKMVKKRRAEEKAFAKKSVARRQKGAKEKAARKK